MKEMKKQADVFLKKHTMHFDNVDMDQECAAFIDEMDKGLRGEASSLKMFCTYLQVGDTVPLHEPVIVIDAGGTNFRVAVVTFDEKNPPLIEDFQRYPMPGTQGEISREEFFSTMAQYVAPVIHKSSKIGFCFSYPVEILPSKDGRLTFFSKEVKVRDVVGEVIGAGLLKALKEAGLTDKKDLVLLNDTVATLLGGRAAFPDRKFDGYIGFILGTGTNTCYIEENKNIVKIPALAREQGSTIINIESGNYAKAPRGDMDISLDKSTKDPERYQLEKMISGAYQGSLMLEVIKKASDEGLFSEEFTEKIRNVTQLESKEIDDFCNYPYASNNVLARCAGDKGAEGDKDRQMLYYIIDVIMERAAKLAAVNLAAVMKKTGKGKNPCLPICVSAEGTTFYKSKLFRGKLEYYVKTYMNEHLGIYCEFVKADNSTITGTAIAGLG